MAVSIVKTLDAIIGAEDRTVTEAQYARLVAYVHDGDVVVARIAYVIRARGIEGADGAASIQRLADDTGRKRSALSQWATAYGYLVTGNIPATAETFVDARRAYNSTAEGRKHVDATLPTIADAEEAARAGMLHSLAEEVQGWKRDAGKSPASTLTPGGEDAAEERETREARPTTGDDVRDRTLAWLDALTAVANVVRDAEESPIALNREDAERAEDLIAVLSQYVTAASVVNA